MTHDELDAFPGSMITTAQLQSSSPLPSRLLLCNGSMSRCGQFYIGPRQVCAYSGCIERVLIFQFDPGQHH